jgi:hypothetical protein
MPLNAESFHLIALFCTLTVEGVGMALWAHFAYPQLWHAITIALVTNLVVHTIFWYSQPLFVGHWPAALYGAEFFVVLLEGAIYARCLHLGGITPWLLSFFLNVASFLVGIYLWQFLL